MHGMHAGWADHLGCYADSTTSRRLPIYANAEAANRFRWSGGQAGGNESLDSCFTHALAGGHKLFGVQEGGDCWLGGNMTHATALPAPDIRQCSFLCWGNVSQVCGGATTLSLYAVRGERGALRLLVEGRV